MKHKIIAAVRTKNEEWIVDRTLRALEKFCETVIVYDDGSTDNTEMICRSHDCVEWHTNPPRDAHIWNAGQQATELWNLATSHDPDYVFILDADEIPTPSVVDFFDSVNEDINLWHTRMVNLFGDDQHYRTDQYRTRSGININWDPFAPNSWKKHTLVKYKKDHNYNYEPLKVGLGSFGPVHPAPNNTPHPHQATEDFYIIHYGKISPAFLSGEKQQFYARNDAATGKGTYESRLNHHMACSGFSDEEPHTLVKCKEEWFWKN